MSHLKWPDFGENKRWRLSSKPLELKLPIVSILSVSDKLLNSDFSLSFFGLM